MSIEIDADLSFSASASRPGEFFSDLQPDGFNEYGVRKNLNDDGDLLSIDVLYRAMEPGLRKNVRITSEFLGRVAGNFSRPIPFQFDHSNSQRANIGTIQRVWSNDALWLLGNIPNTGSSVRSDTIADFTYDPPAITDGSVGFGHDYDVEFNEDAEEYVFVNATLREFSATPFPAGYDNGGLSAAFCHAAREHGLFVDEAKSSPAEAGAGVRFSHALIRDFD
jgi:hypothetical protein